MHTVGKILNDEHINKQARKSSNFHLFVLNILCCFIRDWFVYGELQVFSSYTCLMFQL